MLLDDDVMTDGKPKPGALSCWFRREERIKHFLPDVSRNAAAVVADSNFHVVTEVPGHRSKSRLVVASRRPRFALCSRVKAIRDQVEQRPRNLSREQSDLAGGRIKRPLQLDRKAAQPARRSRHD